MYTKKATMFLYTEMPVHAGSGSSAGVIDLPVQREVSTNLPIIESTSIKGALREHFSDRYEGKEIELSKIEQTFGPDGATEFSGCLSFSRARVLLFPVQSLSGVFAYVTSPMVLQRLSLDIEYLANDPFLEFSYARTRLPRIDEGTALVTSGCCVVTGARPMVVLSDIGISVEPNENVDILARWIAHNTTPASPIYHFWKEKISKDLVIVQDELFRDLLETETEVIFRNSIDRDTGIVKSGGVWTEECIPPDTILWSSVFSRKPFEPRLEGLKSDAEALFFVSRNIKQFFVGGDQTVGRGLVNTRFMERR